MSDIQIAAPDVPKIRPAFTVKKLDGKVKREILGFDSKGKKTVTVTEVDAGWLVKFPKGHSIRVYTEKDLKRLGFDRTIPLVNDDGDVVGMLPNDILEDA